MFLQRVSLTWLLMIAIIIGFTMYGIAIVRAPLVAFKAHDYLLEMAEIHNHLENNYFIIRAKVNTSREMVIENITEDLVGIEELYESAARIDLKVNNILKNYKSNKSYSIEKTLRFISTSIINDAEYDDDNDQAEEQIKSFLLTKHEEINKNINSLLKNSKTRLKNQTQIDIINYEFDVLFNFVNAYFSQPKNHYKELRLALSELSISIDNMKKEDDFEFINNYLEIEKFDELHKKVSFLTYQFYGFYEELDRQSDSHTALIDALVLAWNDYVYFLDTQEQNINTIIDVESVKFSNDIQAEGENLMFTLIVGAIVIILSLLLFFVVGYKRLSGLRAAALLIANGEKITSDLKEVESNDFVSTITKSFNLMILSLNKRETEIKSYVEELSNQGDNLEKVVRNRTAELSVKNKTLLSEIDLRMKNEKKLIISDLALSNISEAVIITDAKCKIIEVNSSYCILTGYSKEESIGTYANFSDSSEYSEEYRETLWSSMNKEGSWSGELANHRKSGEEFPMWQSINSVSNSSGVVINYVSVFRDITKSKEIEKELHNLAYYDHLTALPNRSLFLEHFEHEITVAKRQNKKNAVLFIDLDRFKNINDSLGHQAGDKLLIEVAKRLKLTVRNSDVVARQGGDEFLILLREIDHIDRAAFIAEKIINNLKLSFQIEQSEVYVGSSIGISIFPDDADNVTDLIKNSDAAMYHAKDKGRGIYEFYNKLMNESNNERLRIEQRLAIALDENIFTLHFQPQINSQGVIIGAEALIRWNDSELGMVPPDKFIAIAEESGQIQDIGREVIRMVCESIHEFENQGITLFPIAVNISPLELLKPNFIMNLVSHISEYDIYPSQLELEVTETALLDDIDNAKSVLGKLKNLGFTLALDDFGTGYSSLTYIHQLPFDNLKIDRSFVSNIPNDKNSSIITRTILSFASEMDLKVVAEGVETQEQMDFLWKHNCDYCQGYKISRPLPFAEFVTFAKDNQKNSNKFAKKKEKKIN